VPLATAALAIAIYQGEALESPADGWLHVIGAVCALFVLQFVLFQVAEEVGWTGFFQDRLRDRYGPIKLSAVVAVPWAFWHLPDFFAEEGWGLEQLVTAVVFFVVEVVLLFFARVIIVWLYERTGRSVLLVVIFHASFDATISRLAEELIPASNTVRFLLVTSVVVLAAVAVLMGWWRRR
jgi:membrane protease YdiL (CAAX protease family)